MGNLLNLCKLYVLVNEQRKVAAHRWILADICVSKVHLLHGLHQVIPVNISIEYILLNTECLLQLVAQDTHLYQYLAGTGLVVHALGKDVVVAVLDNQVVLWHTHTAKDILYHSLQLVDAALLISMSPTALYSLTGDEE